MAEQHSGEKTEKPSAKRVKDAREKGQVARSQDLVAALGLLGVTVAMSRLGASGLSRLERRLADGLAHLDESARASIALPDLANRVVGDLAQGPPFIL